MNKDRAIFNQNEKLAMTVNGLESGGMHFNVNEKQADDLVKNEAISKFNTQVDEYVNRFEEHAKRSEERRVGKECQLKLRLDLLVIILL